MVDTSALKKEAKLTRFPTKLTLLIFSPPGGFPRTPPLVASRPWPPPPPNPVQLFYEFFFKKQEI